MLEQNLEKVPKVNCHRCWTLIKCLSQAPDHHDFVALRVIVTDIFHKFGAQSLQIWHELVREALAQRDNQICRIPKNDLIVVQILVIIALQP